MRGNRDFLIGRRFARETGCRLLRDPCRIELGGRPTLLMHGDLLCTDDVAYQRFRRRVRNPLVIRLFLLKSRARRRAIAEEYRRKSGAATADKTHDIMDVNQGKVEELMRRFGVRQLIHGHTHRPADHVFRLGGADIKRLVLAEWQTQRGEVLVASGGALRREAVTPS
jgi:UDP-2,3-diacylglucosamine hydrolase